jgi:hypothetical protein
MAHKLDEEFKLFMKWRGVNIDGQLFDLIFTEPQNFAQYRQADVDTARIATFTQLEALPYFSKRFLLTRYLGLTEAEMAENDRMWAEEHGEAESAVSQEGGSALRSVGITPGGISADIESLAPPPEGGEAGMTPPGAEGAPPVGGAPPATPGTASPVGSA